jgi:hypothetical protein
MGFDKAHQISNRYFKFRRGTRNRSLVSGRPQVFQELRPAMFSTALRRSATAGIRMLCRGFDVQTAHSKDTASRSRRVSARVLLERSAL